jgi:hypothetical protein
MRQLNQSLFVALMAQFQAYCRALHDHGVDLPVAHAVPGQRAVLEVLLRQGRKLDVSNPRRSALVADFRRLDVSLLDELKAVGSAPLRHLDRLDALVDFRNAIGHGDEVRIAAIEAAGLIGATKESYDQHRRALAGLATAMDEVVSRKLAALLQIGPPW